MNILLLFLSTMLVSQDSPGIRHPKFSVESCQEMMMPGDVFYFKVVVKNPHSESVYISTYVLSRITMHLRDSENQTQPLLFESLPIDVLVPLEFTEFKPGPLVILPWRINVPPLEELKEPFWEKHLKNLSEQEVKLWLCVNINSCSATSGDRGAKHESLPFTFEIPITIRQRPEKEMVLIRKWYDDTPKEQFPVFDGVKKVSRNSDYIVKSDIVFIQGKEIPRQQFMLRQNRYPGYPNAPVTWQGWKELEDSLSPSTMQDEIRRTRILIQYCDTKDEAVLKELKEWLVDMNEFQRSMMAPRLSSLKAIYRMYKTDIDMLELFEKICSVTQEFGITDEGWQ